MRRLPFLFFLPTILLGEELPKIALLDPTAGDIKPAHAQDLTIIVSEIDKLGKHEVYSQDKVRTLAG